MHYQHVTDDRVLIRAIGYGARSGRVVEQLGKFGPYEEPLYAIHPDGEEWTDDTIMLIPQSMLDGLSAYEWEHDETVPALYVEKSAEHLTTELAALTKLADLIDEDALDEWSNDELLAHDIGYGVPGPLTVDQVREEAEERLDALPLAIERATTFEIVLGVGGPDRRLLIDCEAGYEREHEDPRSRTTYEIKGVRFRYSWGYSVEIPLTGEAREAAERFASRVVPELVE